MSLLPGHSEYDSVEALWYLPVDARDAAVHLGVLLELGAVENVSDSLRRLTLPLIEAVRAATQVQLRRAGKAKAESSGKMAAGLALREMLQLHVLGSPVDTDVDIESSGSASVLAPELARMGMFYRPVAVASGDAKANPGGARAYSAALGRTRERVVARVTDNSYVETERE